MQCTDSSSHLAVNLNCVRTPVCLDIAVAVVDIPNPAAEHLAWEENAVTNQLVAAGTLGAVELVGHVAVSGS